jgi:hypothetical protein
MSTATIPFQLNADTIPPLTHADRCDKCGARALVVTTIPLTEGGTSDLMWCQHHYRQHQELLLEIACAIKDDTTILVENDRLKGEHHG